MFVIYLITWLCLLLFYMWIVSSYICIYMYILYVVRLNHSVLFIILVYVDC